MREQTSLFGVLKYIIANNLTHSKDGYFDHSLILEKEIDKGVHRTSVTFPF